MKRAFVLLVVALAVQYAPFRVTSSAFTGGILELATSTTVRTLESAATQGITARACVQNGATYGNVYVCQLTDAATDCTDGGQPDCVQQSGYSNVPNCSPKASGIIYCFVGLQNAGYCTVFTINTNVSPPTVTKGGSIVTSGDMSGKRCTLWYVSHVSTTLYLWSGSDAKVFTCDLTSVPCTPTEILNAESSAANAVHGQGTTNLRIGEIHISRDGTKLGLALTALSPSNTDLGCLTYASGPTWKWKAHTGAQNVGTMNCHMSLSGTYVGFLFEDPANALATHAYDYATMTLQWNLTDDAGSGGHQSASWLGNIANDNNYPSLAGVFRSWRYDLGGIAATNGGHTPPQGTLVNYLSGGFSPVAAGFNQISCFAQDGTGATEYCSVTATEDVTRNPSQNHEGELWLTTTDDSLRTLVLTPTYRLTTSGGGFDAYNRAPKPHQRRRHGGDVDLEQERRRAARSLCRAG
jgi:hypothetical protein